MRPTFAVLVVLVGCGDDSGARDAGGGRDGSPPIDAAAADGAAPLTWVDISIAGCRAVAESDAGTGDGGPCRGDAPLALDFAAIAPGPLELYLWTFGDGSDFDQTSAPRHVFEQPGIYDLALDAMGPGGTAGIVKPAAVEVVAAPAGAPCSDGAQCLDGRCVCGPGGCAGSAGVCAAGCAGGCGDGEVCTDLAAGSPADPQPWQDVLCLIDCTGAACPAALACRDLPRAGGGFARACFLAGVGGELGEPCVDPDGAADDDACATGRCLAIGLRGMCTAPCTAGGCPAGAACAAFSGGRSFCLPRCGGDSACDSDPWLGCELAGGPGASGFVVDEPPSMLGYCAPRACSSPAACPVGTCAGGFCGF